MANDFKEHCKNAVPESMRDTHYKLLLDMITKRNIQSKEQLEEYLQQRSTQLHNEVSATESSTKNDARRRAAMEIEMIKKVQGFLGYI